MMIELAKANSELKALEGEFDSKDPINKALLHQAVLAQLMWRRKKTASSKTRSEVHGTTKKSLKQKGSGGARHGAKTAPIFVGGGLAFGPRPVPFSYKMNHRAFQTALWEAVRVRFQEKKVFVLSGDDKAKGKTKQISDFLKRNNISSALICTKKDSLLLRGTKNIQKIKAMAFEGINPYDILTHEHLLLTVESVKYLSDKITNSKRTPKRGKKS